jgi:hypothetical protein
VKLPKRNPARKTPEGRIALAALRGRLSADAAEEFGVLTPAEAERARSAWAADAAEVAIRAERENAGQTPRDVTNPDEWSDYLHRTEILRAVRDLTPPGTRKPWSNVSGWWREMVVRKRIAREIHPDDDARSRRCRYRVNFLQLAAVCGVDEVALRERLAPRP